MLIYTASLSKYADPLLDKLDIHKVALEWTSISMMSFSFLDQIRSSRTDCSENIVSFMTARNNFWIIVSFLKMLSFASNEGHYVKDLSLLGRDIKQTIIVDNSPMSYTFHPGTIKSVSFVAPTNVPNLSENAIDCGSFIDDPSDVEMWQVICLPITYLDYHHFVLVHTKIADFLVGIRNCEDVRLFCR